MPASCLGTGAALAMSYGAEHVWWAYGALCVIVGLLAWLWPVTKV